MTVFITNPHTMSVLAESYPERIISMICPDSGSEKPWFSHLREHQIPIKRGKTFAMEVMPLSCGSESELMTAVAQYQTGIWLMLDEIMDPHNMGACLRTLAAFDGRGLIVPKHRSCPLNSTVRDIACGGAEILPIYKVTNLTRTLTHLKDFDIWVYGGCERAKQCVSDVPLHAKMCLVVGNEGKGLRHQVRSRCDCSFSLPTKPPISSLNVSVATAITLYHFSQNKSVKS